MEINRCGVKFDIESSSDIEFWRGIYQDEYWEKPTFDWILPRLDKEKIFIDIGSWEAPISLVAQQFSRQCICFEPDPVAFEKLCAHVERNGLHEKVICENLAVSSVNGLVIGSEHGLGGGVSTYLDVKNGVVCDTISFAEIIKKYKLTEDTVSVIKIDIEGYERELLKDETLIDFNAHKHISFHAALFEDREDYFNDLRQFFPTDEFIRQQDFYEFGLNKK